MAFRVVVVSLVVAVAEVVSVAGSRNLLKKRPRLQLCLAALLFAISAWLARGDSLTGLERAVFESIYGLPEFLRPVFLAITQLGGIMMLFALVLVYLFKRHYHIVIHLLMSGSLAYLLAGMAKDIWGRPRPQELLAEVIYREDLVHGMGFPSGHTALITAMALVAGLYIAKRYRFVVPTVIALVALSRVYLGVHAPLDIIGGFAIGWFSAELFRLVKIVPKPADN